MKLDDEYFRKKAIEYASYFADDMSSDQINGLYLLLKEVNRDTRHAYAEVRVENPKEDENGEIDHLFRWGFDEGQEAHMRACMNVGEGKI